MNYAIIKSSKGNRNRTQKGRRQNMKDNRNEYEMENFTGIIQWKGKQIQPMILPVGRMRRSRYYACKEVRKGSKTDSNQR